MAKYFRRRPGADQHRLVQIVGLRSGMKLPEKSEASWHNWKVVGLVSDYPDHSELLKKLHEMLHGNFSKGDFQRRFSNGCFSIHGVMIKPWRAPHTPEALYLAE